MSFHLDISVLLRASVLKPFILICLVCLPRLDSGMLSKSASSVSTCTVLFLDEVEESRDMFQKPVFLDILSRATDSATYSTKTLQQDLLLQQLQQGRHHLGGTCTTLQLERRTRVLELCTGCLQPWQAAQRRVVELVFQHPNFLGWSGTIHSRTRGGLGSAYLLRSSSDGSLAPTLLARCHTLACFLQRTLST